MSSRPVRVATFNLHHGAPPDRFYSRRALVRATARLGVDLLALQEVDHRIVRSRFADLPGVVARATGLHPTFARARSIGPRGHYGIALMTAGAPSAVEVVALPRFGGEQRLAIVASVMLGDRRVSVAAAHLQHRPWIAEQQLPVVLERLMARPGPHLLLGDLNAGRRVLGPIVRAAGLEPLDAPPTFPTWRPHEHIDWIAASGIDLVDPQVPSIWTSDHRPLVATVT